MENLIFAPRLCKIFFFLSKKFSQNFLEIFFQRFQREHIEVKSPQSLRKFLNCFDEGLMLISKNAKNTALLASARVATRIHTGGTRTSEVDPCNRILRGSRFRIPTFWIPNLDPMDFEFHYFGFQIPSQTQTTGLHTSAF